MFVLWKNASHTISIYGKILIIDLSCNFLYLWNCMKSVMISIFGQHGNIIVTNSNQVKLSNFKLTYFDENTCFP